MNEEILNRKGAKKVIDVPEEILILLNEGKIETINLTEWLAINHSILVEKTLPKLGVPKKIADHISLKVKEQKKPSTMNSVKLIGKLLHENFRDKNDKQMLFNELNSHQSDSIRCYAPYLISLDSTLEIHEKLNQLKALVSDKHFGVREVVWMSIRPEIEKELRKTIVLLSKWAEDEDENIRRFTTEATRPRGVWCKHIEALKEKPELALPILEKLKSDNSKYVQDSVGNWLNDTSKSKPEFVENLCAKWSKESPTKETKNIIKRAKKTINKNKN